MNDTNTMNFQDVEAVLPENLLSIIQRDATRITMEYLNYTQNKIIKTMIALGFENDVQENSTFISADPRPEVSSGVNSTEKKKGTKGKKTSKAEKTIRSDIQVAYSTFMKINTNIDNTDGIKYKFYLENPQMGKGDLHRIALKEISTIWKGMSAEEKGDISNSSKNNQLKADASPSPIDVNSGDDVAEAEAEAEAECEEMVFGGTNYAVELGDEPRSVYTLEGVEVGTFTTENGIQLC